MSKLNKSYDALVGQTVTASASGGEIVFTQVISPLTGQSEPVSPTVSPLVSMIKKFFNGFGETIHDKKKLAIVLTLTVIWTGLNILQQLGFTPFPVRLLSFLTFARGGTTGGILGIMGGTVGKGVFAYFVMGLIQPLYSGKNPFRGMGTGMKCLFSSLSLKRGSLPAWLMGVGVALLAYNFMAGRAVLPHIMVDIAAFFVSLRALGNQTGFLRSLLKSLLVGKNKSDLMAKTKEVQSVMAGITMGFALALPITAIPIFYSGYAYIGYILGAVCLVASIVLMITGARKMEVNK